MLAAGLRELQTDVRQLVTYGLCVASAFVIAWQVALVATAPAAAPRADTGPERPNWITVHRASGAFDLPARDLDGLPFAYVVRRHATGNGRQDIMAWGETGGAFLRLVVYRLGQEPGVPTRAQDVVRAMAEAAGLSVAGGTAAEALPTKFGPLATAGLRLRGAAAGHACVGAGDLFLGSGVAVAAVTCNAGPEVVDRRRLGCWLDRLTLISAGGQETLAAFFARSELARTDGCGETSTLLAPTPSRGDWIAARDPPRLRGRLAAR